MIKAYFSKKSILLCSETEVTLYQIQGQRITAQVRFELSEADGLASVLAKLKQAYPLKSDTPLIVGLPLRFFNLVNITLPLAAEENLADAITYELARHIPYEPESCVFHYQTTKQPDCLDIQVLLALKDSFRPYLAVLSAAGLTVTAIAPALSLVAWMNQQDGLYVHCVGQQAEFLRYHIGKAVFTTTRELTRGNEQQDLQATLALLHNRDLESNKILVWRNNDRISEFLTTFEGAAEHLNIALEIGHVLPSYAAPESKIDLVSAQERRKKRLMLWFQVAAGALFVLSLTLYPVAYLAGKASALDALEKQLAVVQERAETLDALRQENQQMTTRFEGLASYVRSQPQYIDVLKEVTDIIPMDSWLDSLEIHDRRLILRGTSPEATSVLESLANSPLIQSVAFDSPVVKKGLQESFTIAAVLK